MERKLIVIRERFLSECSISKSLIIFNILFNNVTKNCQESVDVKLLLFHQTFIIHHCDSEAYARKSEQKDVEKTHRIM